MLTESRTTDVLQQDRITLSGVYEAGDSVITTINGSPITYTVTSDDLTVNGDGTGGLASGLEVLNHVSSQITALINADNTANSVLSASSDGAQINLIALTADSSFTLAVEAMDPSPPSVQGAISNFSITPNTMEFDIDVIYDSSLQAFSGWSSADQLRIHSGDSSDSFTDPDWICLLYTSPSPRD